MSNYTIDSFTVKNYRSFYDEQTVMFDKNQTVTAFYGANASGKTNFYRAMTMFHIFVTHSIDPGFSGVPYEPFLLRAGAVNEPSVFSMTFHNNENKYRYLVAVKDNEVVEEAMHDLSSSRIRTIFVRSKGATELAAKNGFGKKMFEGNDAARKDSLLITLARRTANKYAKAVFDVLNNMAMLDALNTSNLRGPAVEALQRKPALLGRVVEVLKEADFAITDFTYNITSITSDMLMGAPFSPDIKDKLIRTGKSIFVNTVHSVRNAEGDKIGSVVFDMERQESLGTNIFFNLIVMIIDAIDNGRTIYFDEFGSSLHTSICQYIIRLFKRDGAKTGAKLIINTHNTGLIKNGAIGVLDKDDIEIVEKDRFEQTLITPIARKMMRQDDNIGKKYAMGMYGGVPILEEVE